MIKRLKLKFKMVGRPQKGTGNILEGKEQRPVVIRYITLKPEHAETVRSGRIRVLD